MWEIIYNIPEVKNTTVSSKCKTMTTSVEGDYIWKGGVKFSKKLNRLVTLL